MNKQTVSMSHNPKKLYTVETEKNVSIRISGDDTGTHSTATPFDKTFKVGDKAEYDSYNLKYFGTIVSIGKTVIIQERHKNGNSEPAKHRLSLAEFAWRNCTFVLAEVERENAIESQYI